MPRHPYPVENKPKVTDEGGSARITIPSGIRHALGLDDGDRPEEIEFDVEEREFSMRFDE